MATKATRSEALADGDLGWPLRRGADLFGSATAVLDGTRTVSYSELRERVSALAGSFGELGIEAGARVGFLGVNSLAHLECVIGVPVAGRVLVDLNFRLALPELAFIVDDCEIGSLVVEHQQLEVARQLQAVCPTLNQLIFAGAGECPPDCIPYEQLTSGGYEMPRGHEHQLAMISYTGGTTGSPKGVMLSHGNLLANARHNLLATGHDHRDRWLHACPMFHVAGTANIFACTWVGAMQVVLPRFTAEPVIRAIRDQQITHMVLVPTMLGMLLDELDRDPGAQLSSLKHIQYAASPISTELQRRLLARFDCDIAQFYGMTEAAPTVTRLSDADHRDPAHEERLRSIGRPVIGVEAQVRSLQGTRMPPGEIGELWLRGPNVMLGYWNRADATAAALSDGWYHSGDAAFSDSDGYLYLVDRLKDMIVSGGENVYSIEVENALSEHPAVIAAAVFGIPHPQWGEAVHAVVSVKVGSAVSGDELIEHCRTLIAGFKVPRSIDLQTELLPQSGAGKVLKNVLREPFWTSHERRIG